MSVWVSQIKDRDGSESFNATGFGYQLGVE